MKLISDCSQLAVFVTSSSSNTTGIDYQQSWLLTKISYSYPRHLSPEVLSTLFYDPQGSGLWREP
jgi:hypothetical protein